MRVLLPSSVAEACAMLAESGGKAMPIAGGTDVMVHWPARLDAKAATYVDLSGLGELRSITWTDTHLVLGALTTYWDVVRDPFVTDEFPLLAAAAREVGAVQIQTRGTWAGNIINASPAADGVPALMAMDAAVVLRSVHGERVEPLDGFYLGYKKMRREADELVTAIRVPRREHDFTHWHKVGARRAQTITKVGIALAHSSAGWRMVANSVAPVVKRCTAVEKLLDGGAVLKGPSDLMPAIRADISPIDDIRSTAKYREGVLARIVFHAVRKRAGG